VSAVGESVSKDLHYFDLKDGIISEIENRDLGDVLA